MSTKSCVVMTKSETSILDILIHVFILASILSIFFLLVIVPLEKSELGNEVNKNIGDGAKHIIDQIKSDYNQDKTSAEILISIITGESIVKIDDSLKSFNTDFVKRLETYYKDEDPVNTTYNNGLVTPLAIVITFILIMIIVIYYIYKNSCGKCPKIFTLVGENLLLFSIIGIIEYMFFTKFASNYIPIKPSLIIQTVNESL